MRAARVVLAIPILLLLAACGYFNPGSGLYGERRATVTVDVVNQNESDAVVHALFDEVRLLLGTAPADSTVSYRIPWRGVGGLRIEFELTAEEQPCITDLVMVGPGEEFM